MIFKIIEFIYPKLPISLKKKALRFVAKKEGGEYWSKTIRSLFKKYHGVTVGLGSYGCFEPILFPPGTTIGNYCSFAHGVVILNANHPMDFVSMHPLFYNPKLGFVSEGQVERTALEIGHDVWIGYRATILSSCKSIGTGAVIGAGAVVTRDVAPYEVVAGVPAKQIKFRFEPTVQKKIIESQWFDKDPKELSENIKTYMNLDEFLKGSF